MPIYRHLSGLINKNIQIKQGIHFYFIRHGQSMLNITNSVVGWTDSQLSPKGRQQAQKISYSLKPNVQSFTSFHTSDLSRCKQTIHLGLGFNYQKPIKIKISQTRQLRQLNFGNDQGVLLNSLSEQYLKLIHSLNYQAPNGQNWPQARQRAIKYLASIASEGHHLVSTHGGLLCALMYHLGLKQVVPNCSVISAEFDIKMKNFSKINFEWRFPQEN